MRRGKVLAIDYGKKRLGFATGDFEAGIAFPGDVVENKGIGFVVENIEEFCGKLGVSLIVVGLPLNMEGGEMENEMLKSVKYFVSKLKEKLTGVDIEFFDERLSSFEADQLMKDAGKTTRDKKVYRDAYAAQIILQRFFDSIKD